MATKKNQTVPDEAVISDNLADHYRQETAGKGLHAKIAWVQQHVGNVEKTGTVSFGKTSFAHMQEHGLLAVLRPLLRIVGLSVIEGSLQPGLFTKSGNSAIVESALTVTDVESGESITRWYVNEGIDNADKAFNKAYTGFSKYALQKFFLIPTQQLDDNETVDITNTRSEVASAVAQETSNHPSASEVTTLRGQLIDAAATVPSLEGPKVKTKLTAEYGVATLAELSRPQFEEFSRWASDLIAAGK